MSDVDKQLLERLAQHVRFELGDDPARWFAPDGYGSVALAVLDSIYSTGNRYSGVVNVVNRYRDARSQEGANADADNAADLVDAVDRWGGVQGLVDRTNRWRTSTKVGAPPKAEAAYGAALLLVEHGLNTRQDVQTELSDPDRQQEHGAKKQWLLLPGQRSGLTWWYFLMLCGVPGVKADRMVLRYVSRAVDTRVDSKQAMKLVTALAGHIGISATLLDHAIWRKESGRPVERLA